MLAFVDESGDPGRKIPQGSSPYFIVALVTFEDNDEALRCDQRIQLLKSEIGMPGSFEFHFSDNSRKVRLAFLQAIAPYGFFYHVFALNKDPGRLYGPGFDVKESLYKFATRLVFENAKPHLRAATVVLDQSGDRRFRDELATYLRRRVREPDGRQIIRKVKIQRSVGNNLLQLADYVAGSAKRSIIDTWDAPMYRRFLAAHEVTFRTWPK